MKIRVYASAFCSFKHIDEDGCMELPEGAVLKDVVRKLRIPAIVSKLMAVSVNYQKVGMRTKLKDGDVVSFISNIGGG